MPLHLKYLCPVGTIRIPSQSVILPERYINHVFGGMFGDRGISRLRSPSLVSTHNCASYRMFRGSCQSSKTNFGGDHDFTDHCHTNACKKKSDVFRKIQTRKYFIWIARMFSVSVKNIRDELSPSPCSKVHPLNNSWSIVSDMRLLDFVFCTPEKFSNWYLHYAIHGHHYISSRPPSPQKSACGTHPQ